MATNAELVGDLKSLRKGRGLFAGNVADRVGGTLRDLCGVTAEDGPAEIRYRVAHRIHQLAQLAPEVLEHQRVVAGRDVVELELPALRTRLPVLPRQLVHVPGRRCDFLELRVRFDRNRLPRRVSRLPGAAAPVRVDGAGEMRVTFAGLTRGFTYGARWD